MGEQKLARNLLVQVPGRGKRFVQTAWTPNIASNDRQSQQQETADAYSWVVAILDARHPANICKDGTQRNLQRHQNCGAKLPRRALGHFMTKAALDRLFIRFCEQVDANAWSILLASLGVIGAAS